MATGFPSDGCPRNTTWTRVGNKWFPDNLITAGGCVTPLNFVLAGKLEHVDPAVGMDDEIFKRLQAKFPKDVVLVRVSPPGVPKPTETWTLPQVRFGSGPVSLD